MSDRNGHAKLTDPPRDLAALRDAAKRARLTAALRKAEAQTHLYESFLWDGFGGTDMFERLFPGSQDIDGTRWVPPSVPTDRAHGRQWPIVFTDVQLDEMRQQSRVLIEMNGLAQSLEDNLCNFVIDEGFAYKITPKQTDPDASPADVPEQVKQWQKIAQREVDKFLQVNRWNATPCTDYDDATPAVATREREIFCRVLEDGEAFVRFFKDEVRKCLIARFVEPEQVRNPGGGTPREGWQGGIRHQMEPYEDVECPAEYHVVYQDLSSEGLRQDDERYTPNGELIPADEILHVCSHRAKGNIARGLPFFKFGVLDALTRAERLQRNASIGASVRAATAEWWEHSVGTQQQVQSLADGLADFRTVDQTTGKTVNTQRRRPGEVARIPAGQKLVSLPPDNTPAYLNAAEGDKQYAAAAACGPSYWLGDQASANYSNLETASAPPVKNGQAVQGHYKRAFGRAVWRALKYAVECGLLPAEALAALDLQVEAPSVLHRNELEDAQVKAVEAQNGVLSPQTWCAEKGRDYQLEQANIEEHQARAGVQGAALGLPGEGEGRPGQGPPGGTPRPPSANVREGKDAEGHEHKGSGPGGGQFTSGGGGGSGGETKKKATKKTAAPAGPPADYKAGDPEYEKHRNAILDAADDALTLTAEGQGGVADLRIVYAWAKRKDKDITPEKFRKVVEDLDKEKGGAQLHVRNEVRDLKPEEQELMPTNSTGKTLGFISSGSSSVKGVAHLKRPVPAGGNSAATDTP